MPTPNLSLTKTLMRLKTIPEYPEQLAQALALVEAEVADFSIEHFVDHGVHSVLIYNVAKRPEKFKLILNCHLDVIPGSNAQYEPRIEADKLYGVGAMDMKANLVCALEAFKNTAKEVTYPIALQIVTDEEIGGFHGTKYQVDQGVNAEFVLSTEPTNFDIVHEAKGVLWLEITAKGETAHGAYPWRGSNAVETITKIVSQVQDLIPNPSTQQWQTTCNVAGIDTPNQVYNKVPDTCVLRLDVRYVPGAGQSLLEAITKLLPDTCSLHILANEPALHTEKDNSFVSTLANITTEIIGQPTVLRQAQGSSDARHFQRVHTPGIEFGPIGDGIGSDAEWVSIQSLVDYQMILEQFISSLQD